MEGIYGVRAAKARQGVAKLSAKQELRARGLSAEAALPVVAKVLRTLKHTEDALPEPVTPQLHALCDVALALAAALVAKHAPDAPPPAKVPGNVALPNAFYRQATKPGARPTLRDAVNLHRPPKASGSLVAPNAPLHSSGVCGGAASGWQPPAACTGGGRGRGLSSRSLARAVACLYMRFKA